jgi:hypothetical protein
VAAVDPDDDTVERYVVRHYRYDPNRHERRHVVVAAFDNEPEFHAYLEATAASLRMQRDNGEDLDPREYVSGTVHEPGCRRRQQNGRLLRRTVQHGVSPRNWQNLELPSNMSVIQFGLP